MARAGRRQASNGQAALRAAVGANLAGPAAQGEWGDLTTTDQDELIGEAAAMTVQEIRRRALGGGPPGPDLCTDVRIVLGQVGYHL